MVKPIQDLVICNRCGKEHGPSEARHVVRFNCGHCGKSCDTDNYAVPLMWSQIMAGNVIRYSLCPDCTVLQEQWLSAADQ